LNPLQPLHNGPSVFKAYSRNNPRITKVTDQTPCGTPRLRSIVEQSRCIWWRLKRRVRHTRWRLHASMEEPRNF